MLRFVVRGKRGSFTYRYFDQVISAQLSGVHDVEVSLASRSVLQWRLQDLRWNGDLAVDLQPDAGTSGGHELQERVTGRFIQQMGLLETDSGFPPDFGEATVGKLDRVAQRMQSGGVTSFGAINVASGDGAEVRADARQTLADLVTPPRKAIGAVTGTLQTLGQRHGHWFTIYDDLFGRAVRCVFAAEMAEEAKAAFGQRVRVSGEVSYGSRERVNRVRVKAIEVLPPDDDLPTVAEMFGSLPALRFEPNGLDADLGDAPACG